jgi:hypothetical protein
VSFSELTLGALRAEDVRLVLEIDVDAPLVKTRKCGPSVFHNENEHTANDGNQWQEVLPCKSDV